MKDIKINEIFCSVSGEVGLFPQGSFTTFIRFTGCNLRCSYCDTKYSYYEGKYWTGEEIIKRIKELGVNQVLLTGGEPLLQIDALKELLFALNNLDYRIQIETNGSFSLFEVAGRKGIVPNCFVVDYKLEGSNEEEKMVFLSSLDKFSGYIYIKFVCSNKEDMIRAFEVREQIKKEQKYQVEINGFPKIVYSLSPVSSFLSFKDIYDFISENERKCYNDILINTQIHKFMKLS